MTKRIQFAQNEGEKEMQKLLNQANKKRLSLDLDEVLTDGRGNIIRIKKH